MRSRTSWENLLIANGTHFSTFKQLVEHWGLLECDNSIRECLVKASNLRMPCALRRLFATISIYCEPTDVKSLWNEFFTYMEHDCPSSSIATRLGLTNRLLRDLNNMLIQLGKQITHYDLPTLTVDNAKSSFFFLDGPRGIGKTFLYHTLILNLRSKGHIVLATTSSGIAIAQCSNS